MKIKCNKNTTKEKKSEPFSMSSLRKACLMISTSRGDANGRQGLLHFFKIQDVLNCPTHCRMFLQVFHRKSL